MHRGGAETIGYFTAIQIPISQRQDESYLRSPFKARKLLAAFIDPLPNGDLSGLSKRFRTNLCRKLVRIVNISGATPIAKPTSPTPHQVHRNVGQPLMVTVVRLSFDKRGRCILRSSQLMVFSPLLRVAKGLYELSYMSSCFTGRTISTATGIIQVKMTRQSFTPTSRSEAWSLRFFHAEVRATYRYGTCYLVESQPCAAFDPSETATLLGILCMLSR